MMDKIKNLTYNGECSRCGQCCSLFIPITKQEVEDIKKYVQAFNIKPYPRFKNNNFNATCCFYNPEKKECMIYEVRPFVCRDFKCDNFDWKLRRDCYEEKAYYNSTLKNKIILASFDDLIYNDYTPIIQYILAELDKTGKANDLDSIINFFKNVNRLDLLKYMTFYDENDKPVRGIDILKEIEDKML